MNRHSDFAAGFLLVGALLQGRGVGLVALVEGGSKLDGHCAEFAAGLVCFFGPECCQSRVARREVFVYAYLLPLFWLVWEVETGAISACAGEFVVNSGGVCAILKDREVSSRWQKKKRKGDARWRCSRNRANRIRHAPS